MLLLFIVMCTYNFNPLYYHYNYEYKTLREAYGHLKRSPPLVYSSWSFGARANDRAQRSAETSRAFMVEDFLAPSITIIGY